MRIVISSGHGKKIRGAAGPKPWGLDEVNEARRVVEHVADHLTTADIDVDTFHDDVSTSQNENLNRIVDYHNSQTRDLDVSVHFNAYEVTTTKPMGTECLYVTQNELAKKVSLAIADAGDFIDRGPKKRTDLFFLNNTEEPAILIETCFVDSKPDADLYRKNFEHICGAIALAISGKKKPEKPTRPLPKAFTMHEQAAICDIANKSTIATYVWKDRGLAPRGYTQGMALAFGQSYRKLLMNHPALLIMARARKDSDKDALHIYRGEFDSLGMANEKDGPDTLRHLYALMLGHGMRESSGQHCEGRDMSAENVESDTAEAGLFQTSYNANNASDPEFDDLMEEYGDPAHEATCYFDAFAEDVGCGEEDWDCYGSGDGWEFQKLCKDCPAFAVESAALTLRNLCNHYGPIIRQEVELLKEADDMFKAVQNYIEGEVMA